ncbi:hypothetical protein ACHAXR_000159, partial [Thalassiosira sp. AJA248-18]
MTASALEWQQCDWQRPLSSTSKVVMGQYDISDLDFMDIPKSARAKLTDGEIGGVFVCIGAVDNLKSLKLTHCFGVSGTGLRPLCSSVVLERIDLCLVKQHESRGIYAGAATIQESVVIPILDGIIDMDGNSLTHVQLPKMWRDDHNELLNQFLERYGRSLNNRRIECS